VDQVYEIRELREIERLFAGRVPAAYHDHRTAIEARELSVADGTGRYAVVLEPVF